LCVFIINVRGRDRARWTAQLRERIEIHEAGSPQFRLMKWRQTFDTVSYQRLFHPPDETTWTVVFPATTQIAVDRACSKSYIAVLEEEEKTKVRQDIQEIMERGDDKIWIDESQDLFEYPYKTWLVIARKK